MEKKLNENNVHTNKPSPILYVLGGIFLIVLLSFWLNYALNKKNQNTENWKKYAIIGKQNVILVYEDALALKIPFDIYLNKEKTVQDIADTKNYDLLIEYLNKYLPDKVVNYKDIKFSEVTLDVENSRNIPTITIDNKKFISTSETQNIFSELYNSGETLTENIIVDILNANGVSGYAKKTGDALKEKINLSYTAANYPELTNYSLIIVNEINRSSLEEILESVNENYFKIKETSDMPTLASVVLILGKENKIDFKINVIGEKSKTNKFVNILKKEKYKNISNIQSENEIAEPLIEYNKNDYYIALKIAKKLNVENMLENNNLINEIKVMIN